jgi:uncharacterized membrane protein YhiD involved in acid resistance
LSDLLKDYSYLDFFLLNLLSILLGFALRSSLALVKQKWVTTYHQTLTFCLLPPITSIITTLISSNIALSLGMIGALSIVRFRTPVKSPLELVMFFSLITIGIGIAVNYKLSLMLTIIIILLIFSFSLLQKIYSKKANNFINNSYDEGTANHSMEIKSKNKISILDTNMNVESFYFNKEENSYNYRLIFKDKNDLDLLKKNLEANIDIDIIDIKYVI